MKEDTTSKLAWLRGFEVFMLMMGIAGPYATVMNTMRMGGWNAINEVPWSMDILDCYCSGGIVTQ